MEATLTIITPVMRVAASSFFRLRSVFIGEDIIFMVCLAVAWVKAPTAGLDERPCVGRARLAIWQLPDDGHRENLLKVISSILFLARSC